MMRHRVVRASLALFALPGPEYAATCVSQLASGAGAQRSRVQILPPLPSSCRSEA